MIVKICDVAAVVNKLSGINYLAFDTETTGLDWYKSAEMFSIAIGPCAEGHYYYFDKRVVGDLKVVSPIFNNGRTTFFAHNAKFDMHMLRKEGIHIPSEVHCTQSNHRLVKNNLLKYSLEDLASVVGEEKLTENIANGDYYGTKITELAEYCKKDTEITYKLGMHQISEIKRLAGNGLFQGCPSPLNLLDNEKRLTITCFHMEEAGVLIDLEYVKEAIEHEKTLVFDVKRAYESMAQKPYIDSGKSHAEAFDKLGFTYLKTEKGNPCFDSNALELYNNDLGKIIKDIRFYEKRVSTYWTAFLNKTSLGGKIHANIKQGGTETGRMSYSSPNLQNLPKEDDSKHPIRKAIIASPGYTLCSIDYEQMEYRLLLDYAGEMGVISKIKEGLDVHQATADVMGVSRTQAKTINFMLLYGGGVQKLALALGVPTQKASSLKSLYFQSLPRVKEFVNRVMLTSKHRGFVKNWAGRVNLCGNPNWAYIMPNHLIQGGCADIVKIAMNEIYQYLKLRNLKSRMIIQVHDEIVLEISNDELHIIPDIKKIMEDVYLYKYLPMSCDVSLSTTNWHDKIKQ